MISPRAHIIGMGEVGRRIESTLSRAGWTVHPVTRSDGWEAVLAADDPSSRIVAVREEALGEVLDRFPATLRDRLVLVQNGFLEPVHGDLGPVTRGLIYFTSKGDFFRVLCPSPFHGKQAATLVDALAAEGIPAETIAEPDPFLDAMIVKGIWNAVVGLPLAVHEVDLASYLRDRRPELESLVEESARACGRHYGVEVDAAAALAKILETTGDLGWVRGGKKALPWRNGAIAWFGRRHDVPTPVNDRLLRDAGYDPDVAPDSQQP
jgi:ketopantoate reductase